MRLMQKREIFIKHTIYINQRSVLKDALSCGRLIKAFKIPDTRGIKLIYNEEENEMIFYEGDEIRFRGQYAIILEVFEDTGNT